MKHKGIAGPLAALLLSFGLASCASGSTSPTPTSRANAGTTPSGTTASGTTASAPAPASTTPTPSGPALSRVQLAAKAEAICSTATTVGRTLAAPADLVASPKAAAAYFDKAVPPLDAETRAFQALNPAAAVSAQWEAVLGSQSALDRLAEGDRQKADAGRQVTLTDVRQLVSVGQTIASAAARIGAGCP